ncbi:MAG: hypothetical protein WCE81_08830 [Halobacteriota archaeon]
MTEEVEEIIKRLCSILDDETFELRPLHKAAAEALGEIGGNDAIP